MTDSPSELPPRYEPNAALRWLYRRFFDQIVVDPTWLDVVRKAASRGTVVYALRNLSLLDFLALDHLTKKHQLPQVRFANDLGLWILEPFGKGVRHAFAPRTRDDDLSDLRAAISANASAALFLKRPPNLVRPSLTGRGLLEGDDYLRELLKLQRERATEVDGGRPIVVIPQLFLWTKRPDRRQRSLVDALIGTREWPSALRAAGQFLANYKEVTVRAGEPLDLLEFLVQADAPPEEEVLGPSGFAVGDPTRDTYVRRVMYTLLRRLERERRVILGPVVKPSDRIVDEVVRAPRVRAIIEELAGEGKAERIVVEAKARAILRETAAAIEPDVIRAMGVAMTEVFSRIYDGLEFDKAGVARLREAAKKGTLVLLPGHKSHMDYLILSYVLWLNDIQVPLIAAGDNLSFFPLGSLFRRAGAFFIRRKIGGDRLYAAVLDAYVHKIVHEGFSIEFFLEGGRSRTGKLLSPKLGLLSMVVDAALESPGKPVFFVPISIGYERVVEARSYVRELSGGEKEGESIQGLVRALRVLAERYGRLNLQVGEILKIDDLLDPGQSKTGLDSAQKRALVSKLGYQVVYEINRATSVTGGSLIAMVLLTQTGRGIPRTTLDRRARLLCQTLDQLGARMAPMLETVREGGNSRAIDDAIGLFASAGWIEVHKDEDERSRSSPATKREGGNEEVRDPVYLVPDEKRISLDISKNTIVHFFVPYALFATAMRMGDGGLAERRSTERGVPERTLRERVQRLSRLFKYEFLFRADKSFDAIFDETFAELVTDGTLVRHQEHVLVEPLAREKLELYASAIASFLEAYRVAARALRPLVKGPMTTKDLTKRAIAQGKRMFLAGEILRREGICRPVLENAFSSFADQGYVSRVEGKLVLAESFATMASVNAIEGRIAAYLGARPLTVDEARP